MIDLRHELSDGLDGTAAATGPLALMERSLIVIIFVIFALSLHRSFIANINWDEFFFLSKVHLYRNGHLSMPLQTFHVHLFGWVPLVSDNEIRQIFAARVFMWLLSLGSGFLIFAIARNFCSKAAALLSVLFYFGFSNVADHGLSFRYDPICAFLMLASLYFLLGADRSRYHASHVAVSAVLMAAAVMVSIKSVFYLGTIGMIFLGLFWVDLNRRKIAKNAIIFAVAFFGSMAVLYQLHSYALATSEGVNETGALIKAAGAKTLLSTPFLPRAYTLRNALFQNGPIWVLVASGLIKAGCDVLKGKDRKNAIVVLSFAVPLLSLLFYRNAFSYFFVFLMPAVVILGGFFADVLIVRFQTLGSKVSLMILGGTILMVFVSVLMDHIRKLPDQTIAQAEIVDSVHRMFPDPVPYIDRNSMISSYPKVGFFMSTWGMENYLTKNVPIMDRLIRREQPEFLLANSCALDIFELPPEDREPCRLRLLDEDIEVLRANFVHHWGAIYVAGKAFDLSGPSELESFEILIPGVYTLEASDPVSIDDVTYQPGDQVPLDQAVHTIVATEGATRAVLRWGVNLYTPSQEPSAQPIYLGL